MIEEKKGTVLVCTPPDGGRTTLLYTILKMHDAYTNNVQTIEIEPAGRSRRHQVPEQVGSLRGRSRVLDACALDPAPRPRRCRRRRDLPDQNTAKEICRADQERSRIYASFKCGFNALAALQTWSKLVGRPVDMAIPAGSRRDRGGARRCVACARSAARRTCPRPTCSRSSACPPTRVKQLFKKGGVVMVKDKEQICGMCSGRRVLCRPGRVL
jgi:hypothetical protein